MPAVKRRLWQRARICAVLLEGRLRERKRNHLLCQAADLLLAIEGEVGDVGHGEVRVEIELVVPEPRFGYGEAAVRHNVFQGR